MIDASEIFHAQSDLCHYKADSSQTLSKSWTLKYLFTTDKKTINNDFQIIQRLLGDKGLSVNPAKTRHDITAHASMDRAIDDVKKKLLDRRRLIIMEGYDEAGFEIYREKLVQAPLTNVELAYIDQLLSQPDIEEEDAELVLTIMGDHAQRVEKDCHT